MCAKNGRYSQSVRILANEIQKIYVIRLGPKTNIYYYIPRSSFRSLLFFMYSLFIAFYYFSAERSTLKYLLSQSKEKQKRSHAHFIHTHTIPFFMKKEEVTTNTAYSPLLNSTNYTSFQDWVRAVRHTMLKLKRIDAKSYVSNAWSIWIDTEIYIHKHTRFIPKTFITVVVC